MISVLPFAVIGLPLLLVAVAIVALIVWVIVRASRSPADGTPVPGTPAAAGYGRWNAHIRREGHLDGLSGFGTLTLAAGVLTFVPDGATAPAWSYPSPSFGLWSNSPLGNSDLTLDSQATGRLMLTVSHQRINRVSQNNFKSLSERDTAREFVQAMRVSGAAILG